MAVDNPLMVGDPLVVGDHLIETFSEDLASAVWWPGVFSPIALNQDLHIGGGAGVVSHHARMTIK